MNLATVTEVSKLLKYLTPQEKEKLDSLLTARPSTEPPALNLTDFKYLTSKHYQHAPHLEALDRALEQVALYVESGGQQGIWLLIVEMPPRHGKTYTVSRRFPAWFLGRNPDKRAMLVSYGDSLSRKNSRYVRNLMASQQYQSIYPISLALDSKAVDAFDIAGRDGGMDALGVLGASTGKGAHILVCDDLVKNREEAESETLREKTWDALSDDLIPRLEPYGAVVLNATRWHQDDPLGRAIKNYKSTPAKPIVRLRLPAIAEQDDALGRNPGEALWSERYPIQELRAIEERMGGYSWSALYQQNPVPAEGGLFKQRWFTPFLDTCPPIAREVRYWDLAMSEKTSADFTAGVKFGEGEDGHWYITDVVHERVDWGNLTDFLANVMLQDGPNVQQGIEEKGYMSRAVQDLNIDPRMKGYAIFGYPVDTDKVTRALPFAAKAGAGLVHVLNRHWTQEYIDELCSFPLGAHDDMVDASSGAYNMLSTNVALGGVNHAAYDPMEGAY